MNERVLEDGVSLFEVISVSDYTVGDGATMQVTSCDANFAELPNTLVDSCLVRLILHMFCFVQHYKISILDLAIFTMSDGSLVFKWLIWFCFAGHIVQHCIACVQSTEVQLNEWGYDELKLFEDQSYARDIEVQLRKGHQQILISFIGLHNAGKSTLINAILGDE